jgi:hypothetical protein
MSLDREDYTVDPVRVRLSPQEISAIAYIAVEATRIRQLGCSHLAVENFTPKLFDDLLTIYQEHICQLVPKKKAAQ